MTGTVVMLTSLIEFPVTINVGGSNMGSVTWYLSSAVQFSC